MSVQVQRAAVRDLKRAERAPVAVRREGAVAHHAPARHEGVSRGRLKRDLARRIAADVHNRRRRGKPVLDLVAARVAARPVVGIRRVAVVAGARPPREFRDVACLSVEKPRGGQHRLDAGLRRLRAERERDAAGNRAPRHQARAARKRSRAVAHVDCHRRARGELERMVAVNEIGNGRQRTRPLREVDRRAGLHRAAVEEVVRGRLERSIHFQRGGSGVRHVAVQGYVVAHRDGHVDAHRSADPERYVRCNDAGLVHDEIPRAGHVERAVVHDHVVEPEALARSDVHRQRMPVKIQLGLCIAGVDEPYAASDLDPRTIGRDVHRADLRGAAAHVRAGVPDRSAVEDHLVAVEVLLAVEVERAACRCRYRARSKGTGGAVEGA